MSIQWNEIKQNRPTIFDWLVFIFSMSMGFVFPSLGSFVSTATFSRWMFVALILYVAGVYLKHRPLYYRLAKAGKPNSAVPLIILLLIGHWIIFLFVWMFAEDAFRQWIGLHQLPLGNTSGYSVAASIFGAMFITWLVFRPPGKSMKVLSDSYLFGRELIADIFLICAVAMLSFVFWEKSLLEMMTGMPVNGIGNVITIFVFLAISFVLFYLPLRYLYLIEDHFSRAAWKRLSLIFLLIMIRALFTALQA